MPLTPGFYASPSLYKDLALSCLFPCFTVLFPIQTKRNKETADKAVQWTVYSFVMSPQTVSNLLACGRSRWPCSLRDRFSSGRAFCSISGELSVRSTRLAHQCRKTHCLIICAITKPQTLQTDNRALLWSGRELGHPAWGMDSGLDPTAYRDRDKSVAWIEWPPLPERRSFGTSWPDKAMAWLGELAKLYFSEIQLFTVNLPSNAQKYCSLMCSAHIHIDKQAQILV